ncbi:MAG TPA: hypothetical protein VGF18_09920 [Candidatus Tumulicola sp.]
MTRFDFRGRRYVALHGFIDSMTAPQWLSLASACVVAALVLGGCYAYAETRVRFAHELYLRADARLIASEAARQRVASERVNVRAAFERFVRLREIRLSGFVSVDRIARIGNRLPETVWLDSFSTHSSSYEIRGSAASIDALTATYAALTTHRRWPEMTFARHGSGSGGVLQFDVRPTK